MLIERTKDIIDGIGVIERLKNRDTKLDRRENRHINRAPTDTCLKCKTMRRPT